MGYLLLKKAYAAPITEEELQAALEAEEHEKEKKKKEEARKLLGLPTATTAIVGAGLGKFGGDKLLDLQQNIGMNILDNELKANFNLNNALKAEQLLKNDNIEFLDSINLAPGAMNSMHPEMIKTFAKLPKHEQANILLRGGFSSPFAIMGKDIIWRGVTDRVSAGTLAHEYGHVLNSRDRKGKWSEKIMPRLYGAGGTLPMYMAAGLAAGGLMGVSDKALLYGGLLGTATGLPRLYEEMKASHRGNEFLKKHNFKGESSWSGVPTYVIPTLLPLLPYLTRKVSRAVFERKDKKKEKKKKDK